jgi:hypothetical protein
MRMIFSRYENKEIAEKTSEKNVLQRSEASTAVS